jgi:hypothetical protein
VIKPAPKMHEAHPSPDVEWLRPFGRETLDVTRRTGHMEGGSMNIKRVMIAGSILAVLTASIATASPGSGASVTPLGAGTFADKIHVSQNRPADVQIANVTFAPGGYTGWHSHPGPEVVTVKSGSVTFTRVRDGLCTITTFGPGQGFVAYPQDTFIVRNASTELTAQMVVILFDVPTGGPNRIEHDDPGIC